MIFYATYEEYGYGDEFTKDTIYVGADLNTAKSFTSVNTLVMETWVEGSLVKREVKESVGNWCTTYDRLASLENDVEKAELELASKKAELEKVREMIKTQF